MALVMMQQSSSASAFDDDMGVLALSLDVSSTRGSAAGPWYMDIDKKGSVQFAVGVSGGKLSVDADIPGLGPAVAQTYSTAANTADRVQGVLRTETVWYDASPSSNGGKPVVEATFLVTDSVQYSTNASASTLTVGLALDGFDSKEQDVACGGGQNGICNIAVVVPDAWFDADGTIAVTYRFASQPIGSAETLGQVTAVKRPDALPTSPENTVYATYPAYNLYAGMTFSVTVRSLFDRYLDSAEIMVESGSLIVNDVTVAQLQSGGDAFGSAINQPTSNRAYAYVVLSGRKATAPMGSQGAATNEELVTITFTVPSVSSPQDIPLKITLISDGIFDNSFNTLKRSNEFIISTRDGVVSGGSGRERLRRAAVSNVYVTVDELMGILPYATKSAEMLNTAVIDLSPITNPITVAGITARGSRTTETSSSTCRSLDANALSSLPSNCGALLDGTETNGAVEAKIGVKHEKFSERTVSFRLHYPVPGSTKIRSVHGDTLRFIAGYYDNEADASCSTLKIQSAELIIATDFSDNTDFSAPAVIGFDVSRFVTIESSDPSTIKVVGGTSVSGVAEGTADIAVLRMDASLEMTVGDVAMLVGIHTAVLPMSGWGSLSVSSGSKSLSRFATVDVTLSRAAKPVLQVAGDQGRVSAVAAFDDGSLLPLHESNGLTITSLAADALSVNISKQLVTVVPNPVGGESPLLRVDWKPGTCENTGFDRDSAFVNITVNPPSAKAISVSGQRPFLVPVGDPAAAVGFTTTMTLAASLLYADQSHVNVTGSDGRLQFTSFDESLIQVSPSGIVTANSNGIIGQTAVVVGYEGQAINRTVQVRVIKYDKITLSAWPEPAYNNRKKWKAIQKLSVLKCSSPLAYQKASVKATMILTDPAESKDVSSHSKTSYVLTPDSILSISKQVLSRNPEGVAGTVEVAAAFEGGGSATLLNMEVSDDEVAFSSINNMALVGSERDKVTLSNIAGRLSFGGTTEDGRVFKSLIDSNSRPIFSGMFSFTSSDNAVISVDDGRESRITLEDNGATSTDVQALYCDAKLELPGNTQVVFGNLLPAEVGDVDLGDDLGAPITCSSGGSMQVAARVNTGGAKLGSLTVRIKFDSNLVEFISAKSTVPDSKGAVKLEFNVEDAVEGGEEEEEDDSGKELVVVVAISESSLTGSSTSPASVFEATFKCKVVSDSSLTMIQGDVYEVLEEVTLNNIGLARPDAPVAMHAGNVPVMIAKGRRRRNAQLETTAIDTSSADTMRASRNVAASNALARRHRREDRCSGANPDLWCKADVNCDGLFSAADGKMIMQYLAFRLDPTGPGWELFKPNMERCGIDYADGATAAAMDADGNGKIEPRDVIYIFRIMVGKFNFNSVSVTTSGFPSCSFDINVVVQGIGKFADAGSAPAATTKMLLDLATSTEVDGVADLWGSADGFLTNNKGGSGLYGALVQARRSASNQTIFTFSMAADPAIEEFQFGVSPIQVIAKFDYTREQMEADGYMFFKSSISLTGSVDPNPLYPNTTRTAVVYAKGLKYSADGLIPAIDFRDCAYRPATMLAYNYGWQQRKSYLAPQQNQGPSVSVTNPGFVGIVLDDLGEVLPVAGGAAAAPVTLLVASPAHPKGKQRRKGHSKFVVPAIRLGRATQAARGLADLMGYDNMSIIQHIMSIGSGVDAIKKEVEVHGSESDKHTLQGLLDGTYANADNDDSTTAEELAAQLTGVDCVQQTYLIKYNH
eukprot:gene6130-34041_t